MRESSTSPQEKARAGPAGPAVKHDRWEVLKRANALRGLIGIPPAVGVAVLAVYCFRKWPIPTSLVGGLLVVAVIVSSVWLVRGSSWRQRARKNREKRRLSKEYRGKILDPSTDIERARRVTTVAKRLLENGDFSDEDAERVLALTKELKVRAATREEVDRAIADVIAL